MPDTYHVFSAERGSYQIKRAGADGVKTVAVTLDLIAAEIMAVELGEATQRSYDQGIALGHAEFERALKCAF